MGSIPPACIIRLTAHEKPAEKSRDKNRTNEVLVVMIHDHTIDNRCVALTPPVFCGLIRVALYTSVAYRFLPHRWHFRHDLVMIHMCYFCMVEGFKIVYLWLSFLCTMTPSVSKGSEWVALKGLRKCTRCFSWCHTINVPASGPSMYSFVRPLGAMNVSLHQSVGWFSVQDCDDI